MPSADGGELDAEDQVRQMQALDIVYDRSSTGDYYHAYGEPFAEGVIVGLGTTGYRLALQAAAEKLHRGVKQP